MKQPSVVAYRIPQQYPPEQFRTVPAEITSAASAPFKMDCDKPRENPVGMSFGVNVPYKTRAIVRLRQPETVDASTEQGAKT
jgi:hypothetical protein